MTTHSPYSPSSAHRWIRCPASVAEALNLPAPDSSIYAEQGTACHQAVEELDRTGSITTPLTEDWQEPAVLAANRQRDLLFNDTGIPLDGEHLTEEPVTLEPYGLKDIYGTVDVIGFASDTNTLLIVDYKFGAGVKVSPKDNPQLLIYALGAMTRFPDTESIVMAIIQPRIYDSPQTHRISREELENWLAHTLIPAYNRAKAAVNNPEKAVYNPSEDACRWCPANNGRCKASLDKATNLLDHVITTAGSADPDLETLGSILRQKNEVLNLFKRLEAKAVKLARQGQKIPGMKLVRSYGRLTWSVPDAKVEKFLRNRRFRKPECYTFKILTPAQAKQELNARDKLNPKALKWIEAHTTRPDRGLVIVPEDDPRPEAIDALTTLDLDSIL